MSGRPDFEHLEASASKIANIGQHLAKLREQLLLAPAEQKEPNL
jgi:hypothetical protein